MKSNDPLGKRALFSVTSPAPRVAPRTAPAAPQHMAGLFDVTVHCSTCDKRTTISAPEFLLRHFPLWAWLPGRKHSRLMRCPSCNRLCWCAVSRAA
jgi:hypothetical protein